MKNLIFSVLCSFFIYVTNAQCVLTTGSYTEADVESCLATCGCSTIQIPDGNTVTMSGDWDLTGQGDIDIIIYGETGQLVMPGNGGAVSTLSLTDASTLTFEDSNNIAPISGGNSNNQPRIVVGNDEYFTNDFADVIAAGGVNPLVLPVKLTFFAIEQTDNGFSKLMWQTASEESNKGFSIIKNGNEVAFISGQGNSNETIDYTWVDEDFSVATATYQLVQYDFDSTVGYHSDFIGFEKVYDNFTVFPNPVVNEINVASPIDAIEIQISNLQGQLLKTSSGGRYNQVDVSDLSTGIYILQVIKNGRVVHTKKVMKR